MSLKVQAYLLSDGIIHVHQAGCADIKKSRLPQRSDSSGTVEEHESEHAFYLSWYADQLDEAGIDLDDSKAVEGYAGQEFKFYACVKGLDS
jgi:hypothetical protein